MSKKRKIFAVILSVLMAGTLAFIWGHSAVSIERSAEESSGVFDAVSPVFNSIFGTGTISEWLFRKMAHFGEFFILGLEVEFLILTLKGLNIKLFSLSLAFGLFVGAIDEIIQVFSSRGATVRDVIIDFSGFLIAYIIFVMATLFKRLKEKKTKKS